MLLPDDFQFSQNNLQNYIDCARRFQLRHILHQDWPAIQTEPIMQTEQLIELGQNFHRLVYQQLSGIPANILSETAKDHELETLWQNYLNHGPARHEKNIKAESTLSIPFAGYRLVAKYDLLVFHADAKVTIYDWKTSRKQPKLDFMSQRMQSKIYPFVLSLAGRSPEESLPVDGIEMVYWFPYHPSSPISFTYNLQQQNDDRIVLEEMVKEILTFQERIFPLTMDPTRCKFCIYRSLCQRGEKAGNLGELENLESFSLDPEWDLDFEKIEEIEF
jgi:hypothetical protein